MFVPNSTQGKLNEIPTKIILSKDNNILKPRSYTFDAMKSNPNNPIKINLGNLNYIRNNILKNSTNLLEDNLEDNENENGNKKHIFLNTNKLPKIITRLSLSNFHKKINNNNENSTGDINNMRTTNKFNIFNKTSGILGFKGITFNNGLTGLRNTSYNFNIINNPNTYKLLNSHKEIIKYKIIKNEKMNQNNINIIKDPNNINILNSTNSNTNTNKEKKKLHINKNTFNTKTVIHKNNKYYNNNIHINQINNNIVFFKNNNRNDKEKNDLKEKEKIIKNKENEEKNNLCEENNDSFINELNDLFSNVKSNNDSQPHLKENIDEINKNNDSDDDDKEPDPRINFEQISRLNKSRPQTSYGGLNARRKNLQSAIQNVRNKNNNRPTTCNIPE